MRNTGELEHIVVGLGEVGAALRSILECAGHDPSRGEVTDGSFDVVHICFPHTPDFDAHVRRYRALFAAQYVVIHSTVPIGTSRKLDALFSPIRGVHPMLKQGILTFEKYVAGDPKKAWPIASELKKYGIPAFPLNDSDSAEAAKLWDTTQYGIFIMLEKEIHEFCARNKLNPEIVYGRMNRTYNEGYRKLGRDEVLRPYLKHKPGKIGGHCVIPNARMLESESARRLLDQNEKL